MFVFPIKKDGGAFFTLFAEWKKDDTCILTFLNDYQRNPATAEPYSFLIGYDAFNEEKDLVLLRAEFLPYLTKPEASGLVDDILSFYVRDDDKFKHVETFNHRPTEFNFPSVFGF